ncbi:MULTISPECIES: hypothetical protein [Photorhabdus]|uniref:hypothetical protein n=1 Tax=Photorhabdus TaxID=29487 RepID=UPI0002E61351|nr:MULTISPECIES: hypothetical protein [Photorhabdus]NDK93183.1 hypothetical protein [Photorhabdus laumondii subsp. laumondii]NDL50455.1 hypothetical protein [Photorhabdus laumondii subsp. laumondii]
MTGVSECSQQRGNLKDNGYILLYCDVTRISNQLTFNICLRLDNDGRLDCQYPIASV